MSHFASLQAGKKQINCFIVPSNWKTDCSIFSSMKKVKAFVVNLSFAPW